MIKSKKPIASENRTKAIENMPMEITFAASFFLSLKSLTGTKGTEFVVKVKNKMKGSRM